MNRLFDRKPDPPPDKQRPAGSQLDEEQQERFEELLGAIYCASMVMDPEEDGYDPKLLADYDEDAREMGCSRLTVMVESFLSPVDRPEWVLLCHESVEDDLFLGELHRDVTDACACIVTPEGHEIESGEFEPTADGWVYRLKDPENPRLATAIALVLARGAPWVNA